MKLYKTIRQYIKNKATPERSECEQMLGTSKAVNDFRNFYNIQADGLELVMSVGLLNFCTEQNPSPEEVMAYKKAQADVGMMFDKCWVEIKKKKELPPAS